MKPNLDFLRKVEAGNVRATFSYSARTGGRYAFRGGEATAKRHAEAGFIKMPRGGASLGRPVLATLTEAGITALANAPKPTSKELDAALAIIAKSDFGR